MFLLLALVAAVAAEECNIMCHANWEPVCGTDGVTYGNACELTSLACMRRSGVTKLHNGECTPTKTQKLTGCQIACNMNYDPVCGTDGATYGNECELTTKACLQKSSLAVAFAGECMSEQAECQLACTMNYEPVCGSDGRTYGNMCELTSQACLKKTAVVAAYEGECCQMACNMNYEPICGTDGRTYGNMCELTSQACLQRSGVAVAYSGECTGCQMACNMNYEPVCGSDGVTYGNMCELTSQACLKRKNVVASYNGECQESCQLACNMNYEPVCGSDGVTYGNMCELTSQACLKRSAVKAVRSGEC